jgi:hypothetical protein
MSFVRTRIRARTPTRPAGGEPRGRIVGTCTPFLVVHVQASADAVDRSYAGPAVAGAFVSSPASSDVAVDARTTHGSPLEVGAAGPSSGDRDDAGLQRRAVRRRDVDQERAPGEAAARPCDSGPLPVGESRASRRRSRARTPR